MKVLYNKYDKKLIPTLPRIVFPGRKVVIISQREAEKAVDYLLSQPMLGFDTETRPSFKKGCSHKVALLQVSTYDTCFLFRLNRIGLSGFIDLQDHMSELGIVDKSLAKLYANFFGERISKREQLSNWEADVLSEKQQNYAATDAWACLKLYDEYVRLKETGDYQLVVVPEPEATNTENISTDEENISKEG